MPKEMSRKKAIEVFNDIIKWPLVHPDWIEASKLAITALSTGHRVEKKGGEYKCEHAMANPPFIDDYCPWCNLTIAENAVDSLRKKLLAGQVMVTKKKKWGGNFNCDFCPEHSKNRYGQHLCGLYKVKLRRGRVPGLWVLPCSECHINKTYGGSKTNDKSLNGGGK